MNQYEVFMDVEPLEGEPFSINRDTDLDLRIEFNIQKDVRLDPNKGEIRVYNLNQGHEQAFAFRYVVPGKEEGFSLQSSYGGKITLYAGYRGEAKQIFEGNIVRAYTEPSGGDRVTYIQVMHQIANLAGGVVQGPPFPKGTKQGNILNRIISSIEGFVLSPAQREKVNTLTSGLELKNSETVNGSALQELKKFSNRFAGKVKIFFDENGPQILGPGEANGDETVIVSKENGLMGSPSITDTGAVIRMRLNPGIRNGTPIEVDSEVTSSLLNATASGINKGKVGRYVAEKITHLGDNYPGGEWTTEVVGIYEGGVFNG